MSYNGIDYDRVRKDAEDHWEWLQSVLSKQREMEHKLFVDAWIHSHKHTVDEINKSRRRRSK